MSKRRAKEGFEEIHWLYLEYMRQDPGYRQEYERLGQATTVPLVGFVIHQLTTRTSSKVAWGFDSSRRRIIRETKEWYGDKKFSSRDAFLVWELTLCSDGIPESYREHDRGAWH